MSTSPALCSAGLQAGRGSSSAEQSFRGTAKPDGKSSATLRAGGRLINGPPLFRMLLSAWMVAGKPSRIRGANGTARPTIPASMWANLAGFEHRRLGSFEMALTGACSNLAPRPKIAEANGVRAELLARASDVSPRPTLSPRGIPTTVAIAEVLRLSAEPLQVGEIAERVEQAIGRPVKRVSIKATLAQFAADEQCPIRRVARGRYAGIARGPALVGRDLDAVPERAAGHGIAARRRS